jgi:hypothetical protein
MKEPEDQLRTIIDTIPTLAWAAHADGSAEFFNKRWLDYAGISEKEAEKWGWTTSVHPQDRTRLMDYWHLLLASGESGEIEARLRRWDGQYRWFLLRACPFHDKSGEIIKWYGTNTDIEDRKKAEEAVRWSERNLRAVLDSIPGLVLTKNAAGHVEGANQQFLNYTGRTLNELKEWPALVHVEDRQEVTIQWQQSVITGQTFDFDLRLLGANGQYRWFHVRDVPLRDAEGDISRWYSLFTDVQDRKIEEELRRANEDRLRQIIESVPGMIACADAEGMHDYANKRVMDYVGMQLAEVAGEGWIHTIHPDERDHVRSAWIRSVTFRQPMDIDHRWRRFDGTYRWFHARVEPLLDERGSVIRWYGLLTDIDDLKQAHEDLRTREQELSLIVETIPALVWCADKDGRLTYVNQRVISYIGSTFEELVDCGWLRFLHPEDEEMTMQTWSESVATGQFFQARSRLRRSDGVYRWFQLMGQPLRNAEGLTIRWYGLLIDMNDYETTQELLREREAHLSRAMRSATVGELAASIAHEVNQPLAAVVANGYACLRWLSLQSPNLAKAQEAAERIVRDGNEAGEVIQRVRGLFKMNSGTVVQVDLNDLISEVLKLMSGELTRKRVIVHTELPTDLPTLTGDRIQLQQLVLNLVLNGVEAMDSVTDRKKCLTVQTSFDDSANVLVKITDSGRGLKDPEKAFEAFYTTKENGMGMGLSICRSIIEAHKGKLWALPGKTWGTMFCFSLPILSGEISARTTAAT